MRFFREPEPGSKINPHRLFQGAFVPDGVLGYRGLTPSQKLCYGQLLRMAGANGRCWPSVSVLGHAIALDQRSVQRILRKLESEKFIARESRLGRSNIYVFLWHPCLTGAKRYRQDVHVSIDSKHR